MLRRPPIASDHVHRGDLLSRLVHYQQRPLNRELKEMLNGPARIPAAAETVIVDIPNNLLRRRPDIRLTELRIATQSPQIGIAKADMYPHFYLFGTIGWRSSDATRWPARTH